MSIMNDRANGNSAKNNNIKKLNKAARNILFYADEKKIGKNKTSHSLMRVVKWVSMNNMKNVCKINNGHKHNQIWEIPFFACIFLLLISIMSF